MKSPSDPCRPRGGKSRHGRIEIPFDCGDYLTLIRDPAHCYMVGGVFHAGQVADTLFWKCWANGTVFQTDTATERLQYEVYGRALILISREPLGNDGQDVAVRPYVA